MIRKSKKKSGNKFANKNVHKYRISSVMFEKPQC